MNLEQIKPKEGKIEYLSDAEKEIITYLSSREALRVLDLQKENLDAERGRMVGIRSEDLFILLDSVHKGYISVGSTELMSKRVATNLHITPNPESTYMKQHNPDMVIQFAHSQFSDFIKENLDYYSTIAVKQGIFRNLISLLDRRPKDELLSEAKRLYQYEHMSCDAAVELFYRDVSEELMRGAERYPLDDKAHFDTTNLLRKYLHQALPPP